MKYYLPFRMFRCELYQCPQSNTVFILHAFVQILVYHEGFQLELIVMFSLAVTTHYSSLRYTVLIIMIYSMIYRINYDYIQYQL